MSPRMNWTRAAKSSRPSRSLSNESDLLERDRASRWLAKAEANPLPKPKPITKPQHAPEVQRVFKKQSRNKNRLRSNQSTKPRETVGKLFKSASHTKKPPWEE